MINNIGEKIKLLRIRNNIKQAELAKALNVNRSHICNLENGNRNVSIELLVSICNYFDVDISYFFTEETPKSCLDLIDKANVLFNSKELSIEQKDNLFRTIMRIYLDSKEK